MAPHDLGYERFLLSENGARVPHVLPHHLFVLAAASASKETGLYPLTGMENTTKAKKENRPPLNLSRPKSPEDAQHSNQGNEEEELKEQRLIIQMNCTVKSLDDGSGRTLNLLLKLDDKMNRQLSRKITDGETPLSLATDLVHHGLINEIDVQKVATKIEESMKAPA